MKYPVCDVICFENKKTNIKRIIIKHKTIKQNITESKRHKTNSNESTRQQQGIQ